MNGRWEWDRTNQGQPCGPEIPPMTSQKHLEEEKNERAENAPKAESKRAKYGANIAPPGVPPAVQKFDICLPEQVK